MTFSDDLHYHDPASLRLAERSFKRMNDPRGFTDDDVKDMKSRLDPDGSRPLVGLPLEKWRALLSRLEAGEKAVAVLDNIHYCFQNIWALDRKKFETEFMPRIKDALETWRKACGVK